MIALEQEKVQLKEKLKEKVPDVAAQVEDSLVDKYCHAEYTAVLRRNRTLALKVTHSHIRTEDFSFMFMRKSSGGQWWSFRLILGAGKLTSWLCRLRCVENTEETREAGRHDVRVED